jgi:hypothetical protein
MASAEPSSAKTIVADAFVFFGATDLAYKKIFPAPRAWSGAGP